MSGSDDSVTPWVERYRPRSLDDVSHQNEVVSTLRNAVQTGRLPHLLLYGPPGSGKTSVALALCRQLWHPSQWRRRVLELNASDERGISVVRDKIKHFASLAVGSATTGSKQGGPSSFFLKKKDENAMETEEGDDDKGAKSYPNPPFKIIILDEADTVTPDAQAALRRIIEAHSRVTRFILICNYVTRIIEPLASRCAKFRFHPLPPASMKERLTSIAMAEKCGDAVLRAIDPVLEVADGDMRRAVTTLQSVRTLAEGAAAGAGGNSSTAVDANAIAEIVGRTPPTIVDDLWKACSAPDFDTMRGAVEEFCLSGFSAQLLLGSLLPKLLDDPVLTEACKADISIRMAEAEKNMTDGADEYLQLTTVCSLVQTCFHKSVQARQ